MSNLRRACIDRPHSFIQAVLGGGEAQDRMRQQERLAAEYARSVYASMSEEEKYELLVLRRKGYGAYEATQIILGDR